MLLARRTYALMILFFLTLSVPSWAGQESEKVIIGHSNIRNDIASLWVPKEAGFFRKYGLDVSVVLVGGGQRMIQAIVSGSVPMGFIGASPMVSAVAGGADTVMILGITNRLTYDIWAKPEIKKAEDLKNRTLAISSFGSSSHVASFLMLQHFNIDEKKDHITFLALGDEPTRAQALIAGRIDATLVDPSVSGPLKERGFSYLGNLQELGVPFINNALVTTRRYAKEHPHVAEAAVKAITEGNVYMLNPVNRAKVTEILAKYLRLDAREAETAYEDLLPKVERKPYPSMEALKATLQVMGLRNPKIAQLRAEDLVDLSILQGLEQSGFVH